MRSPGRVPRGLEAPPLSVSAILRRSEKPDESNDEGAEVGVLDGVAADVGGAGESSAQRRAEAERGARWPVWRVWRHEEQILGLNRREREL